MLNKVRKSLITRVEPGSPADGKLQLHDVIVGVNDRTRLEATIQAVENGKEPYLKSIEP